jgi:spore germination protein YaaH
MAGPAGLAGRRELRRSLGIIGVVAVIVGLILLLGQRPGDPLADALGAAEPDAPIVSAAPPLPGHEVYGFVPYWEIDGSIAAHLRRTDATTIALFSVTQTGKGALATNQNGYRRLSGPVGRRIIADAHKAGRKVDLTWTSFGRDKNAALFASEAVQARLIAALVDLHGTLKVDGLAVDVEGINDRDIPAFGAFVGRLRAALRSADADATVTAATGAGRQGAALAFAATVAGADRIFLMGYDYRIASSAPGASAPLVRGDGGDRSLAWSLDLYRAAGIPVEQTLLGLPLYGLAWPAAGPAIGAASTAKGATWVPRRNVPTIDDAAARATYDPVEHVQFLAVRDGRSWQAIYYDTPRSLAPKLGLANERGLAGAGFWALGYERGLPDYTKLISDFRAGRSMADRDEELAGDPAAAR